MKKSRCRVGDVVSIPIGDGMLMLARVLRDASVQVYDKIYRETPDLGELRGVPVLCSPGVFDSAITSGEWKKLGHLPFADDQTSWPPPKFIRDVLHPDRFRIYERSSMRTASREEVASLEEQRMYKPEQLVSHLRDLKGLNANMDTHND